jgi:hypothetical protein
MTKSIKLTKLRFKDTWYAIDLKTNKIYDLSLVNKGELFLLGELKGYPKKPGKPILFVRIEGSRVQSTKKLIGKKLDELNLGKYNKFIETEFAPGGPGYVDAKKRFESRQKSQKRAKTLSRKKSKSKSRSNTRKVKTIGGKKTKSRKL